MGKNKTRILMPFAAFAMVLTALIMVEGATSIHVCNVDTSNLEKCRSAATGANPPPPGPACCRVIKAANLQCFCSYKNSLSRFGINPSKVKAGLASCGAHIPACFQD